MLTPYEPNQNVWRQTSIFEILEDTTMGYEPEADRAKKRNANRRARHSKSPVSYSSLDWKILSQAIEKVTQAGGALRFGKSRDSGSFSLGVYGDGDPYTEWFRDGDELGDFLDDLGKIFQGRSELNE